MSKYSTSHTRALRRSFYNSRALTAIGRFLDAHRATHKRIGAVALVLVFVIGGSVTDFPTPLDPCPTEDSTMCYWDGNSRGNKTGVSFIALTEDLRIYL